jgi:hypothetical protein
MSDAPLGRKRSALVIAVATVGIEAFGKMWTVRFDQTVVLRRSGAPDERKIGQVDPRSPSDHDASIQL